MRVVDIKKLQTANLKPCERLFVELWHSMTHMRSLDSYRVRCLNSRLVIRELFQELTINLIDEDDLRELFEETNEILNKDTIVCRQFPAHFARIAPLLKTHCQPKKGQAKKGTNHQSSDLYYILSDLNVILEKEYFDALCDHIPSSVKPDNENEISSLTGALLSDLTDRGWHLESLHSWCDHFLAPMKGGRTYTFIQNLEFMLQLFRKPPLNYDVTLRIYGGKRIVEIASHGAFKFAETPSIKLENLFENKWGSANPGRTFGTIRVSAVSAFSAAISARDAFEELANLLCFNFERERLTVDQRCYVMRLIDEKKEMPLVQANIPNPVESIEHKDFLGFVANLNTISQNTKIEPHSLRLLNGAIRQYRFGRDSDSHKDKFLNWWMGLEALTYVTRGRDRGITESCG